VGESALGAEVEEPVKTPETGGVKSGGRVLGHRNGDYLHIGAACQPDYLGAVNRALLALGIVLVLVGFGWILQGLGVSFGGDSFMVGNRSWTLWGSLTLLIGALVIWRSAASRRD
jgi:hypothetical protein